MFPEISDIKAGQKPDPSLRLFGGRRRRSLERTGLHRVASHDASAKTPPDGRSSDSRLSQSAQSDNSRFELPKGGRPLIPLKGGLGPCP